jgi:hypothetical protein
MGSTNRPPRSSRQRHHQVIIQNFDIFDLQATPKRLELIARWLAIVAPSVDEVDEARHQSEFVGVEFGNSNDRCAAVMLVGLKD